MKLLEAEVLERLVGRQLLTQRANEADKATGAENAKKALETIQKNTGGDEALARQLKTVGMSLDDLKSKLNDESVAEAVLQREIKFEVSDDDVKKYFDENPSQFEQPELVRAAHILIGTREKDAAEMTEDKKKAQRKLADDLLKRAKAGEDFAKLAKDYSEDPGSKDKGGEYTFPRGQMVPEFEAAAFSMETNQVSDIVTTQFGYHIIKTLEKKPAKKFQLTEVGADVKLGLKRQGMQKQIPAYIEGIKKAAGVEILDQDIKKIIEEQMAAEAEMEKANDAKKADAPKPEDKKSDAKK
jgi:parvulin-like peptidyl-prolyl isomerase